MRTLINDRGEFLSQVAPAQAILDFVDAHENSPTVRWYFLECWADFVADTYDVVFRSYVTPEFKDHRLEISAYFGGGEWQIRREHRTPSA